MVSTRKKRQSNKRLLSQLDDFDQDIIIGNATSDRQENVVANEGTNDRDFTSDAPNVIQIINKNAMNMKTLERCFNERIDREMGNIVDVVEDKIQNAIMTAIDNLVAPKIELAIRSINASSGRDAISVSANSENREHAGIFASFGNASENNNALGVTNIDDETRHSVRDGVSELSVTGTQVDRHSRTHHTATGTSEQTHYDRHLVVGPSNLVHHKATELSDTNHHIAPRGCIDTHHMMTGRSEENHHSHSGSCHRT